jgi:hypothetical protein
MKTKLFFTATLLLASLSGFSQWASQANVPHYIGQMGAVAHPNGSIYLIAGYDTNFSEQTALLQFDQLGNFWIGEAPLPHPVRGMGYALGADSLVYIFSGYDNSNNVDSCFSYSPKVNLWNLLAPIPYPVWYSAAATGSNGKIYVFGGSGLGGNFSTTQIYDPKADSWIMGANMPIKLMGAGAVAASNGKIYVMGGLDTNSNVTDSVEAYDPVADTWSWAKHMPTARQQFAYCKDENGNIYAIGGKTSYFNATAPFLNNVEMYNPTTNTWTIGTPLPNGLGELAGACINNGINVFGGADSAMMNYSNHNFRMNITPDGIAPVTSSEGFTIYPNPGNGKFAVSIKNYESGITSKIEVFNMLGQQVYSNTFTANSSSFIVDLSGFSKGLYFMEFSTDNTKTVKKLVIQ